MIHHLQGICATMRHALISNVAPATVQISPIMPAMIHPSRTGTAEGDSVQFASQCFMGFMMCSPRYGT
jgi:hypothetical protein